MTLLISIDTGTTNTRVRIWKDQKILALAAREVGVRDTAISGSKSTLQKGIRECIEEVLAAAKIQERDIELVLGSGMLTSNLGLHEVPHLPAPVGLPELAQGMVNVSMPEITSQPVWLIPGVKNVVKNIGLHNCEAMDMMRGEEVEVMGVLDLLGSQGPAMFVMPGSHSKFICIDDLDKITGCVTTLAGELLDAVTHHTLLSQALEATFATSIEPEMLIAGAHSAQKIGLGRACFNVRTLDQFTIYQRNDRANFLLGAILGADLLTLKNSSAIKMTPGMPVFICGKPVLKEALAKLIEEDDYFSGSITVISDENQQHLSGMGAMAIARARGLIRT